MSKIGFLQEQNSVVWQKQKAVAAYLEKMQLSPKIQI